MAAEFYDGLPMDTASDAMPLPHAESPTPRLSPARAAEERRLATVRYVAALRETPAHAQWMREHLATPHSEYARRRAADEANNRSPSPTPPPSPVLAPAVAAAPPPQPTAAAAAAAHPKCIHVPMPDRGCTMVTGVPWRMVVDGGKCMLCDKYIDRGHVDEPWAISRDSRIHSLVERSRSKSAMVRPFNPHSDR